MAPRIVDCDNVPDGVSLDITLAAVPSGPLTFYASIMPEVLDGNLPEDDPFEPVVLSGTGVGPYRVQVREYATLVRYDLWMAVEDSTGVSEQEPGWVCYGSPRDWLNLTQEALQEILKKHHKALNKALQIEVKSKRWPDRSPVEVAKIHTGLPVFRAKGASPTVSLRVHDFQEDLYIGGNPYTDAAPLRATLYAYLHHQGETSQEGLVQAVGMAVLNVLNRYHNLEIRLPNNLDLTAAHCGGCQTNEVWDEGNSAWLAVAEIGWSAELSIGLPV